MFGSKRDGITAVSPKDQLNYTTEKQRQWETKDRVCGKSSIRL
jgi:hypothetical protein